MKEFPLDRRTFLASTSLAVIAQRLFSATPAGAAPTAKVGTTAPAFTLWVDGVNGADCEAPATLTAEAAFASIDSWGGAVGAVAKDKKVYFYQRSATGAPTVTLYDDPVL